MSIFNLSSKKEKLNLELNCKLVGTQLHNELVSSKWNHIDRVIKFLTPITKYDKSTDSCLLLTGYTFELKDDQGEEHRTYFAVYDALNGVEQHSWEYGHGHFDGLRQKSEKEIAEEDMAMKVHKKLTGEFSRH